MTNLRSIISISCIRLFLRSKGPGGRERRIKMMRKKRKKVNKMMTKIMDYWVKRS